jgi:AAA+ ATPase superfamily predicted ATPase
MAKERCSIFHGRETILDKIADYLQRKDDAPFTVYGPSGSGKTSIIAEAARKVSFYMKGLDNEIFILNKLYSNFQ